MKKTVVKIMLGMAVTAAIGTGAAAGNGFIVSSVLASSGSQDTSVITPDTVPAGKKTDAISSNADTNTNTESPAGYEAVIKVDDNGKQTIVFDESLTEEQKLIMEKDLERRNKDLNGGEASETGNPVFVEGIPSADDLTEEEAVKTAKEAVIKEYALTDATLLKFSVHTAFNVADPEAPVWSITFYPTNPDDYSEIGNYNITIDSLSGNIIKILSAADGVG
jgi:hypothetical protein